MPQPSSVSLPLDIIYLVIDFIDEPGDLSQLALTSKSLHRFITSNDLYFRKIRCSWDELEICSLFTKNALIASRVRKLDLLPKFSPASLMPPRCRAVVTDKSVNRKGSMELFKEALTKMVNLTKLSWSIPAGLTGEERLGQCLDIVLGRKDVQDLYISPYRAIFTINPSRRDPKVSLDHLTRIDLTFSNYRSEPDVEPDVDLHAKAPNAKQFIDFIVDRCPKLEDLSLNTEKDNSSMSAPRILVDGHWPNLRRLTLHGSIFCLPENVDLPAKATILNHFWARHSNLECLLMRFNQHYILDIQSGLLPKLKSLSGFLNPKFAAVSTDVLAHIEHLCDMTKVLPCPRFSISHFKHTSSLTSLVVMILDEDWEQLLVNHPTITHFALHQPLMYPDASSNYALQRVESIFKTLSGLPSLTHLFLFKANFRGPSDRLAAMSQFPKLKYVLGLRSHFYWDVLERDAEGKVIKWHQAGEALNESLESFEEWGCNLRSIMGT